MNKRALSIGATAIALCLAASGLAQVDPNRTVAIVNGVEIRGEEYYRRMEFLPGVGKVMGGAFAQFSPGFLTLEQLITEKLILQLAKSKNCEPSEAEVKDEIDYANAIDPDTMKLFMSTGQSEKDFHDLTYFNLCQFKLATRGVNVTDKEVEDFYKNNIVLFTQSKMLELRVIAVTSEEEAKAVDADLKAGKAFADVAKARSKDMSANTGGDFGKRAWTDLSEQARKALDNVKVGGMSEWIVGTETRVRFLLVSVDPEVVKPLDALMKKKIRRELLITKGSVKNGDNMRKEMLELRSKASIDIKNKEFADAYKKFIQMFLESRGSGG